MNTAQGLFQRWTDLLQDPSIATREELDWTTNELRNNLRSVEWDLEDLDETINILLCKVLAMAALEYQFILVRKSFHVVLEFLCLPGYILSYAYSGNPSY